METLNAFILWIGYCKTDFMWHKLEWVCLDVVGLNCILLVSALRFFPSTVARKNGAYNVSVSEYHFRLVHCHESLAMCPPAEDSLVLFTFSSVHRFIIDTVLPKVNEVNLLFPKNRKLCIALLILATSWADLMRLLGQDIDN